MITLKNSLILAKNASCRFGEAKMRRASPLVTCVVTRVGNWFAILASNISKSVDSARSVNREAKRSSIASMGVEVRLALNCESDCSEANTSSNWSWKSP